MLHANTIDRALNVGAEPGESVGRAVIDGCVVTYWRDSRKSRKDRQNERFIQKVDRYYHEV